MAIVVRGEKFCSYCQSVGNVLAASDRAGLNSFTVVNTANPNGLTYWSWMRPNPGEANGGWIRVTP